MGLNSGEGERSTRLRDGEDDMEGLFEMDEDYYTTKFVRVRHQKEQSFSLHLKPDHRKLSRASPPPSHGKKRHNNKVRRMTIPPRTHKSSRSTSCEKKAIKEESNLLSTINMKCSVKTHASTGKRGKAKQQVSRLLHRTRKMIDESISLSCAPEVYENDILQKGHINNIENVKPGVVNERPKGFLKSNFAAGGQPSTIASILKNIGIKRESHLTKARVSKRDNEFTENYPFVQSLDPLIFKSKQLPSCDDPNHSADVDVCDRKGEDPAILSHMRDNSVSHAIFQALFGGKNNSSTHEFSQHVVTDETLSGDIYTAHWDAADDEMVSKVFEDNDILDVQHIPRVNEQWFDGIFRNRSNSLSDINNNDNFRPSNFKSATVGSPILAKSSIMTDVTPLLSSTAFEYALSASSSPPGSGNLLSDREEVNASDRFSQQSNASDQFSPLEYYISADLITQLVLQLPHDEPRVVSPRLSVLKSLYKNCATVRKHIVHALELATYNRALRCQENILTTTRLGIHYDDASEMVFRQAFSADGMVDEIDRGNDVSPCNIPVGTGNKFRDHDKSLIELMMYMTVTDFPVLLSAEAEGCLGYDDFLQSIVNIVTNMLRCYGSHLTTSAGVIDDCEDLKGIIFILRTCFSNRHCESNEMVKNATEKILKNLMKYWPKGNTSKELAYWKVVGVMLPNLKLSLFPKGNQSSDSTASKKLFSFCATKLSPSLRILRKLVDAVSSNHFKISLQAIQIVMKWDILEPLFLTQVPDKDDCTRRMSGSLTETLVTNLRQNRCHWHAAVKTSSENALDMLMEYL